tara:strand:- start:2273 stop:2554 length:282 start_codon:yes stop_codon:yes gene_type:complete
MPAKRGRPAIGRKINTVISNQAVETATQIATDQGVKRSQVYREILEAGLREAGTRATLLDYVLHPPEDATAADVEEALSALCDVGPAEGVIVD